MPSQKGDSRQLNECKEADSQGPCLEADFQGPCLVLGKRKQPKDSRKDRDQDTLTKDASRKKRKKKGSTCKDTLGRKKEKKKDKKKKKRKPSIDSDSNVIAQVNHADPPMIYKTPSLCRHLDQEDRTKRKKKVVFDWSPCYIRVQPPQFVSASRPKKDIAFENKTMEDVARLREDNNSPCNSEDVNSQDLFITQRTFRVLSPDSSSGETCVGAGAPTQQSIKSENGEPEASTTHLYGEQHLWKSHMTECLTEEKMRMKKSHCRYENGESCSQVKVELQAGLSEYESVRAQPQRNTSLAQAAWTFNQISASTQTENFFTSELSSYLSFVRKASARLADLEPLDLSLPQKARKDTRKDAWTSAAKALLPGQNEGHGYKKPEPESAGSSKMKEVKKEPSAGGVAQANLSLCSQSGQKSADSTASSGEEQPSRSKLDLTQVRAVQTRLNESFFFKSKGDGQSPRPQSPLMKLIEGRDRKNRKEKKEKTST